MRSLRNHFDKYGFLITTQGDGGDSAFFTSHYYTAKNYTEKYMEEHYSKKVDNFLDHICNGKDFRRHWNGNEWYGKWDRMSRDQMTGVIVMCGFYGKKDYLHIALKGWLKRMMFMANTRENGATKKNHGEVKNAKGDRRNYNWKLPDFAPTFGGVFIRSFRSKFFYPLLYVYDLELLLSAVFKTFRASKSGDDLNFISRLYQAKEIYSTPWSYLARKIYKIFRQPLSCDQDAGYKIENRPQEALAYYSMRGNSKYPPMDVVWKPILDTF